MRKPRLILVTAVMPFPGKSGQQQRVRNKLLALRDVFDITVLTFAPEAQREAMTRELREFCDTPVVLPNQYGGLLHQAKSAVYHLRSGLKRSNYMIGEVEFTPSRIEAVLSEHSPFDVALFEYWHSWASIPVFRKYEILTVLDMHNILWQSYERQMNARSHIPAWLRERHVALYRDAEEESWQHFDALIAINRAEEQYTRGVVGYDKPIFYTPMGTDLDRWAYDWQPASPARVAYYGGLGSPHNQQDARRCYERIMPIIWQQFPDAQFWIVGSNPPDFLKALAAQDERVQVTGFVEEVQDILRTMTTVLCPWEGTYGFRSRLIEVMALGVPVVASPDAVYGMDLTDGCGIFLRETDEALAEACCELLNNPEHALNQSQAARQQVEAAYSYDATYGKLAHDLARLVQDR